MATTRHPDPPACKVDDTGSDPGSGSAAITELCRIGYQDGDAERMTRRIDQNPPFIRIWLNRGLVSSQGQYPGRLGVEVRDR
jgi:hypothetical protein